MRGPARQAVIELLDAAEAHELCCIARSGKQQRQLSRAVSCGIAVSPFPRLFARKERWELLDPDKQALIAARSLQIVHPTWVFAGPTAALVHGLWVGFRYCRTLFRTSSKSSHAKGFDAIRRIIVGEDTPVTRDGVRVTSFLRTVYDCLRTMPFCDALCVADSVLRTKGISPERLINNMNRRFSRYPGMERVRSIIELADPRSENGGESIVRAQVISLGFATPDLQRKRTDSLDPHHGSRVDFAWDLPDKSLVIGELDGREKYTNPAMLDDKDTVDALLAERRREAHLTLDDHPVRVMRFSLAEAMDGAFFSRLLSAYGVPRAASIPPVAQQSVFLDG